MKKDGFILYTPQMKAMASILTDEELGRLMRMVLAFQESGQEPEWVEPELEMAWAVLKVQFEMDNSKYRTICEKRKENGRLGGLARVANASKSNQINQMQANQANPSYKDIDKEKEKDKEKDKDKECISTRKGANNTHKKKFKKPTLTEVQAYCNERRNNVDPERFISHYEANGWKVGKAAVPMVDWKAAVRTWEGNGFGRQMDITAINNGRYGDNDY